MSHTLLLSPQIKQVIFCGTHLNRYPFPDRHAKLGKLVHFIRIVGEKPHTLHPEIFQDLCADVIFPLISRKAPEPDLLPVYPCPVPAAHKPSAY